MKKPLILLVAGGFLVIIGIALSIYGSQLIIDKLASKEERLGIGMSVEISKELDPAVNENGVFVVQTANFGTQSQLKATVFDPFGTEIVSKTIDSDSLQEIFKIPMSGTYKLVIENTGEGEVEIMGVLGSLPQDESLTVSIFGFIVIILGLVGLAVGIIYVIKVRNKKSFS
jgi:hypothetical protein